MRRHLAGLIVMLATVVASAAPAADRWTEISSPHFIVLTNAGERKGRHIANQLEQMRSVFHLILPTGTSDDDVPITVFALKDKKSFQTLEPANYLAKGQLDLAGYFQRSQERNYILLRLDAQGEHPFAIVYHEYTHYMLRKSEEWLPTWLDEGMAEFYQNTDIDGKRVRLGQPSAGNIILLRESGLIPLTTLLQIDHSSPYYHEEQKGNIFYAESWALTHYLLIRDGENKTHHLEDYVHSMMEGQDSISAAQSAFGDLTKLNHALDAYVRQTSFMLYKANYVPSLNESSFHAKPVDDTEVDAIRADVLALVGRTEEARTMLASVLQQDPENPEAYETMGFIELRAGQSAAAQKWFGEAVHLNSTSYLAYYYDGLLRMRNGDAGDGAVVISSFNQSIALNPKFAPAYDALATFYSNRKGELEEAYIQELRACAVDPGNVNYRLNAASILADQHKFPDALSELNAAARMARSTVDKENVQFRLRQTRDYQAAVERQQKEDVSMSAQGMAGAPGIVNTQVSGSARGTTTVKMIANRAIAIREASTTPRYPTEPPTGVKHTVRGVIGSVQCYYPAVLTLGMVAGGKTISLYSNDFLHVNFSAANFTPQGMMNPCAMIEGMKARVVYAEVSDKSMAGQILSVELTK
ncbi:MAG TPA: tetratricopeptide repeat protein [Acidobacteriaceae bacterium]|nr:tetratricopeptide repeat protein [Acidobacteriaceae bacterium]